MTSLLENDLLARQKALDPRQSFIVQAPAGSGKTELLTQRFLVLLGQCVKNPEEIIAITFTRKAAAEMRSRIIEAIQFAAHQPSPEEAHKRTTWELARQVVERDIAFQWRLLQNPNRLRILTIDALCARLAAQLPMQALNGSEINISDNAEQLYTEAASRLLKDGIEDPEIKKPLSQLLLHLDNQIDNVVPLLVRLLGKREQWLPTLLFSNNDPGQLKAVLEQSLVAIADEAIDAVWQHCQQNDRWQTLLRIARFAGQHCAALKKDHPQAVLNTLGEQLANTHLDISIWRALANLILTQKGDCRQKLDKRDGFPPRESGTDKEQKQLFQDYKKLALQFIEEIAADPEWLHAWQSLQSCPPLHYQPQQWQLLQALLQLLPLLAGYLQLTFQQQQTLDFTELSLAALRALGDDDSPTDLALTLDYTIQHLLIDEFQDTSMTQLHLLEKLIRGWSVGDGHSLFLVGDPMQSIYRFRNAEVGIFLRAQSNGIQQVALEPLQLTRNFRSDNHIVNWVNDTFQIIFPGYRDITTGAVPLSPALAATEESQGEVKCYPLLNANERQQADTLCHLIVSIQAKSPKDSIAILVRTRSELNTLTDALRANNIDFQAVDIESLDQATVIQDLMTLTHAITHLADQTHWLALCRSPLCGLTLQDLLQLVKAAGKLPLWHAMQNPPESLTDDGRKRLQRITPIVDKTLKSAGIVNPAQWLKQTWQALGGAACLTNSAQAANVNTFFDCVDQVVQNRGFLDTRALQQQLQQQSVAPNCQSENPVQIMTLHKSKGLEFDHVIIPGLHRKAANDKSQLLLWLERPNQNDGSDLILAPIKHVAESNDEIYKYCQLIEKSKLELERARLLYVGATRAKKTLHWVGKVTPDEKDPSALKKPDNGSLLAMLWPRFLATAPIVFDNLNDNKPHETNAILQRLPAEWQFSVTPETTTARPQPRHYRISPDFNPARHIGTVIHEALAILAITPLPKRQPMVDSARWRRRLQQLGVMRHAIDAATEQVKTALNNTLNDAKGQWILALHHEDARCECPITYVDNDKVIHCIIDRTFIDEEGTRWIIDYKTSQPAEQSLEEFYQSQQHQYAAQLAQYAQAMQQLENKPVQTLLYFPLALQY